MTPALTGRSRAGFLAAACCIAAVLLALYGWLPLLAEKLVLPGVLPDSFQSRYSVSVYRLGPGGCTLEIREKPGTDPLLSPGTVRLDWSLRGLVGRRLESLTIDGLQARIPRRGGIKRTETGAPPRPGGPENSGDGFSLPFFIDAIHVVNSSISLPGTGHFPLEIDARRTDEPSAGKENPGISYRMQVMLAEQDLQVEVSLREKVLSCLFAGDLDLGAMTRLLRLPADQAVAVAGTASTRITADLELSPFSIHRLDAESKLHEFAAGYGNLLLRGAERGGASLSLQGTPGSISFSIDDLAVTSPLQAAARFNVSAALAGNSASWQGNLHFDPAVGQDIPGGYTLVETPSLSFTFSGEYSASELRFAMRTDDEGRNSVILERDGLRIAAADIGLETQFHPGPGMAEKQVQWDVLFTAGDLGLDSRGARLHFPGMRFEGRAVPAGEAGWKGFALSGRVTGPQGSLDLAAQELHLAGMHLESRLAWPPVDGGKAGTFRIDNILFQGKDLGSLQAGLFQESSGFGFKGELQSGLIPDGLVSIHGAFHVPDTAETLGFVAFSAADLVLVPGNLRTVFPAVKSLDGEILLDLEGGMTFHRGRNEGSLDLRLREGMLELPDTGLRAEGIELGMTFPSLPDLHTAPAQNMTIRSITGDKLALTDVAGLFRLESPASLFVEELSARWSGGRIFTSSFRLDREPPGFEAALICDRLSLASVLTQLGLARAEGEGRVSGRIPLRLDEGNFYVDDGFLFSTPGETGTLRILQSEHLTRGLPGDVPQLSPLYFAGEALRDFRYDWAKLLVSSGEENLQLKLQIDGRPAEKLPYRFDSTRNVFVRLPAGAPGGIDQPVKLDVNFNIPLNELLRYYKLMQPILHNIR
jgi:hypothetical protein